MPARKPKKGESFGDLFPEISKLWHPTKNGDKTPFDFTKSSSQKVWWKCNKGPDHEWNQGLAWVTGCPICSGLKVVNSNSLATLNPKVSKDWHPTKNGILTPNNVSLHSNKKVWWICSKDKRHEWQVSVSKRSLGSGCPYCSNQKTNETNSLKTLFPKIFNEIHPNKNFNLEKEFLNAYSSKIIWWKCNKGPDHEWKSMVSLRTRDFHGCPMCSGQKVSITNSLNTIYPELSKEWHYSKNGILTPKDVTSKSGKKVWWKCDKGDDHVWKAKVSNRANGKGCPVCAGQMVVNSNSLKKLYPKIASQWNYKKNGLLIPENFSVNSNKAVWWKCDKGLDHEWKTEISSRVRGRGCPVCANKKITSSNCLSSVYPKIAKEWHPTKNGKLTPYDVVYGTHLVVWWKCNKGDDHEWKSSVKNRTLHNSGCSICTNQIVVLSNCLATTHPELANQWHPTKNGKLTPYDIVSGSHLKIWWKCDKGLDHEWKVRAYKRAHGVGCPYCTLTPQSKQELIITHELITIFKGINPKGFKTRVKGKLRSIDIYIPDLKLGIEFDGSYWHKDKRALDKLKTEELEAEGFNIIRVRQKPLKRIFDDDVMAEKKYDGKKITNDILTQIMIDYKLDKRTITKIHKYIKKPGLQNEKGLDKYIDMILTEKAERKKND